MFIIILILVVGSACFVVSMSIQIIPTMDSTVIEQPNRELKSLNIAEVEIITLSFDLLALANIFKVEKVNGAVLVTFTAEDVMEMALSDNAVTGARLIVLKGKIRSYCTELMQWKVSGVPLQLLMASTIASIDAITTAEKSKYFETFKNFELFNISLANSSLYLY